MHNKPTVTLGRSATMLKKSCANAGVKGLSVLKKKLQEIFSLAMFIPFHALFLETFNLLFDQVKRPAEDGVYAYTCTDFMFSVFTFLLSPCIYSRDLVEIILVYLNTKEQYLLPDPNFQP